MCSGDRRPSNQDMCEQIFEASNPACIEDRDTESVAKATSIYRDEFLTRGSIKSCPCIDSGRSYLSAKRPYTSLLNSIHRRASEDYTLSTRSKNNANASSFVASAGEQSRPSQLGCSSHMQQPSSPEEKTKATRQYLAIAITISYTIFLIIFGVISFVGSAITNESLYGELFLTLLMVISVSYMMFLAIDIRRHIKRVKRIKKQRDRDQYGNRFEMNEEGPIELSISDEASECFAAGGEEIQHKYCFMRGRHGEFLYLKLGAAWFCFGLLIHSCIVIFYEIYFVASPHEEIRYCGSPISLTFEIIFPIFAIFTLLFIYKYINLIINSHRKLARFMFLHMIATSISFWIYQIVCETKEAVILSDASKRGLQGIMTSRLLFLSSHCKGPESLNNFYKSFSPYLYPFMIEFFILSAGVWTMMFLNINKCPKRKLISRISLPIDQLSGSRASLSVSEYHSSSLEFIIDHDTHVRTNIEIHADCYGSNKGLFLGLILVVLTICFIILFFITTSEKTHLVLGLTLDRIFELVVLLVMIIAVIGAYIQTSKLDVNTHHISKLDDILLFLSIPAYCTYAILSMIPAVKNGLWVNVCNIVVQVVQVVIQVPFVMDGLRRCSNTKELVKKKPGREFVTFLTIANVSLWIYYTFSVKTDETGDERYEYYGYTIWSILYHLCLPLIMFYRFHSSVCLVDIWKHAYEPSGK